jgi:hypothetical protein
MINLRNGTHNHKYLTCAVPLLFVLVLVFMVAMMKRVHSVVNFVKRESTDTSKGVPLLTLCGGL